MVTALITSFILLAAIIYAVCRWQSEPSSRHADEHLLQPQTGWTGLFAEDAPNQKQLAAAAESEAKEKKRHELLERAGLGEKSALSEASSSGDAALYEEILVQMVELADSEPKLLALVSYVTREGLRVNRSLAERLMDSWRTSPDRGSTAKMLHIVALADDAALYQRAVETALEFWRQDRIRELSAEELRSLIESEYWILSQTERSSGQGFLLKLKLAALRRELTRGKGAPA